MVALGTIGFVVGNEWFVDVWENFLVNRIMSICDLQANLISRWYSDQSLDMERCTTYADMTKNGDDLIEKKKLIDLSSHPLWENFDVRTSESSGENVHQTCNYCSSNWKRFVKSDRFNDSTLF